MPNIKKVTLPSGNTYDLVDAGARELISALSGSTAFLGLTTTALTDGATTNPITVNGSSVTATNGNIVVYESAEFIWDGAKWVEFGDLSSLGDLAYKDTASVSFSGGTTDKCLGSDATFTTSVTPTTTNIKATASGTAVGASSTDKCLGSDATFTTSVTPTTSKLVTTSVPNVTAAGSASTWSFTMGTGTDSETIIISGANSTAPTLGTAITAATGSLAANGGGASVATGITSATTTTNSKDEVTAITGVSVTTQPTIALATGATAGTGVVSVATGITSATTTANNKDEVTAVTSIGTGTAS